MRFLAGQKGGRPRRWQWLAWTAPLAAALAALPWIPTSHLPTLAALQALAPFAIVVALLVCGIAACTRRWIAAAVTITSCLVCGAAQLGVGVPGPATAATAKRATNGFSVFEVNCDVAGADAASLRGEINTRKPSVIVLVEADEALIHDILTGDLARDYPYRTGAVAEGGISGTVIISRHPLRETTPTPDTRFESRVAQIDIGNGGTITVIGVHPFPPIDGAGTWQADMRTLHDLQVTHATTTTPLIMTGDFNATPAHPEFRALNVSMEDAGARVGLLGAPTWPSRLPVLTLDHTLHTPDLLVASFTTVPVPGTDHLGTFTVFE